MPGGSPCFLCSGDFCRVEVLAVLQHFQMDVRFLGAFTADGAHGAQLLSGGHGVAGFHGGVDCLACRGCAVRGGSGYHPYDPQRGSEGEKSRLKNLSG